MRPAAFVHEITRIGAEKVRAIVLGVLFGWSAFVAVGAGGLALLTFLLQGPWWLYWVVAIVALGLLAPVVFLAFVVLGILKAWRESAEQAARVEATIWPDEGPRAPPGQ